MPNKINDLAHIIFKILKSDRYCFIVCSGLTGEGKSCFTTQLCKETALLTKTPFTYNDNLTFSRKELKIWIDGNKEGKEQKPEHTSVLADELISMFFKRNWYANEQIDGIELLNKCRDRHLLIAGNIPDFWDLDKAIYSVITFWVHIHKRGVAWVFQQDTNPFTVDKWNRKDNQKTFYKNKTPYKCRGFVTEIIYPDWSPQDKIEYYAVRNVKRKDIDTNLKKQKESRFRIHRNKLIRELVKDKIYTPTQIANILNTGLRGVHNILEK